ncbi:MAG: hypothetical protein SNG35_02795 [Rikenellaceae bacterium]
MRKSREIISILLLIVMLLPLSAHSLHLYSHKSEVVTGCGCGCKHKQIEETKPEFTGEVIVKIASVENLSCALCDYSFAAHLGCSELIAQLCTTLLSGYVATADYNLSTLEILSKSSRAPPTLLIHSIV